MFLLALAEAAAREGVAFDEARWRAMFAAHGDFLRRCVARMVGPGEHVDDVVQDTFVTAFKKRDHLPEGEGALRGWLYRTAMNHAKHDRRSLARDLKKADRVKAEPAPASHDAHVVVEASERVALVRAAVASLPEKMREAFILVELEQQTAPAAAALLEVPEDTVRSRVRAARARFREFIEARRAQLEGAP